MQGKALQHFKHAKMLMKQNESQSFGLYWEKQEDHNCAMHALNHVFQSKLVVVNEERHKRADGTTGVKNVIDGKWNLKYYCKEIEKTVLELIKEAEPKRTKLSRDLRQCLPRGDFEMQSIQSTVLAMGFQMESIPRVDDDDKLPHGPFDENKFAEELKKPNCLGAILGTQAHWTAITRGNDDTWTVDSHGNVIEVGYTYVDSFETGYKSKKKKKITINLKDGQHFISNDFERHGTILDQLEGIIADDFHVWYPDRVSSGIWLFYFDENSPNCYTSDLLKEKLGSEEGTPNLESDSSDAGSDGTLDVDKAQLRKKLTKKKEIRKEKEEEIEAFEKNLIKLESKIANLQKRFKNKQEEIDTASKNVNELQATKMKLDQQVEKAENIQSVTKKVENLKAKRAELTESIEEYTARKAKLNKRIKTYTADIKSANAKADNKKLKQIIKEIETKSDELADLYADQEVLNGRIERNMTRTHTARKELTNLKDKKVGLDERIEKLKGKMKGLKSARLAKTAPVKSAKLAKANGSTQAKNKLLPEDLDAIEDMKVLRESYGYYGGVRTWFPEWAIQKVIDNWDKLMKHTLVFYSTNDENKNLVTEVVEHREPVNIGMDTYFNKKKIGDHFGPTQSFYTTHYDLWNTLAPNIAVYTPTYVDYKGNTNTFIHVLNSVGYAFDDPRQPDYKYFIGKKDIYKDITEHLVERYEAVFRLMVACAKYKGLSKIVVSLVGADSFAKFYQSKEKRTGERPADLFQRTVWAPAFIQVHKETLESNPEIKWMFMGAAGSTALRIVQEYKPIGNLGWFPDLFEHPWVDLRITLFINAWDPHSVQGNGNEADESLDGKMGRITNIAVNGTARTNKYLEYIGVDA